MSLIVHTLVLRCSCAIKQRGQLVREFGTQERRQTHQAFYPVFLSYSGAQGNEKMTNVNTFNYSSNFQSFFTSWHT